MFRAYYHPTNRKVQSVLVESSKTTFKNMLKLYMIYGRLRIFQNKLLKRMYLSSKDEVSGGWRKLHHTE